LNKKYYIFSILLSLICIFLVVYTNNEIAKQYALSGGKTRALFGLVELLTFSYKYWFIGLSISSLILAFIGKKTNKNLTLFSCTIILGIASLIIVFIPIWRIMI